MARPETTPAEVARTQAVGRTAFARRAVLLADERVGLLDALATVATGAEHAAVRQGEAPAGGHPSPYGSPAPAPTRPP